MKENTDKKPSKSEKFRKIIKDMCSDVNQDIESKAEREYLQRKYHISNKFLKNIGKEPGK